MHTKTDGHAMGIYLLTSLLFITWDQLLDEEDYPPGLWVDAAWVFEGRRSN